MNRKNFLNLIMYSHRKHGGGFIFNGELLNIFFQRLKLKQRCLILLISIIPEIIASAIGKKKRKGTSIEKEERLYIIIINMQI